MEIHRSISKGERGGHCGSRQLLYPTLRVVPICQNYFHLHENPGDVCDYKETGESEGLQCLGKGYLPDHESPAGLPIESYHGAPSLAPIYSVPSAVQRLWVESRAQLLRDIALLVCRVGGAS